MYIGYEGKLLQKHPFLKKAQTTLDKECDVVWKNVKLF